MGAQNFHIQPSSTAKGSSSGSGKMGPSGNTVTTPVTSGQPSMGQPNTNATSQLDNSNANQASNQYPNTVGQWDNATIGNYSPSQSSWKYTPPVYQDPMAAFKSGKGGSTQEQPAPVQTSVFDSLLKRG